MIKPTEKIWHNGKLLPWDEAKIHVLSHVVSYGTSACSTCHTATPGTGVTHNDFVYRSLGAIYLDRGEFAAAEGYLRKVVARDPGHPECCRVESDRRALFPQRLVLHRRLVHQLVHQREQARQPSQRPGEVEVV